MTEENKKDIINFAEKIGYGSIPTDEVIQLVDGYSFHVFQRIQMKLKRQVEDDKLIADKRLEVMKQFYEQKILRLKDSHETNIEGIKRRSYIEGANSQRRNK